jgi:hypothetical protein
MELKSMISAVGWAAVYENRGKKTPSGRRPDGATRQGLS